MFILFIGGIVEYGFYTPLNAILGGFSSLGGLGRGAKAVKVDKGPSKEAFSEKTYRVITEKTSGWFANASNSIEKAKVWETLGKAEKGKFGQTLSNVVRSLNGKAKVLAVLGAAAVPIFGIIGYKMATTILPNISLRSRNVEIEPLVKSPVLDFTYLGCGTGVIISALAIPATLGTSIIPALCFMAGGAGINGIKYAIGGLHGGRDPDYLPWPFNSILKWVLGGLGLYAGKPSGLAP